MYSDKTMLDVGRLESKISNDRVAWEESALAHISLLICLLALGVALLFVQ
jgi:hypothetical protein